MADRYWVGGTADWDGTAGTKWASTSGGAGGQAVPTSADDVFFDAASTGVCNISTGNTGAKSINCTGFTGTLGGTGSITVSGSVTLVAGMSFTNQGTLTLNGTGTLTTAGKTIGGSSAGGLTIDGAGITVTLGSDLTIGTTVGSTGINFILTQGTLDLNGFTVICSRFSSTGSNTRAIAFGSTNIQVRGTGVLVSMANATNFTCTGTGGFARVVSLAGTSEFTFGSTGGSASNAPNLTITSTGNTITLTTGSYFKNVNFTGSTSTVTGIYNACGSLTLGSGGTYTAVVPTFLASGTITSAGRTLGSTTVSGSGIAVVLADAMTLGATDTFTLSWGTLALAGFTLSTGIFDSSALNTRSINFGSGNIALTSTVAATTVLSMATATNFTWTGTGGFTRNQAATAEISFGSSSGGTASNAPNLTVNAGASTLTLTTASWFKNLDFTGSTCPVSSVASVNIAGNLTLSSGGTYTSLFLSFRGTGTITSAGKTLGGTTINAATHTVTLADAMTLSASTTFFLTAGTFDLNNFNLNTGVFSSSGTSTRAIYFGSGNIALTSTTSSTTVLAMTNVTGFSWTGTGGFTRNQAATANVSLGSSTGGVASRAMNLKVNAGSSTLTITANSYFRNVDFTGSTCTVTATAYNACGNLTLATGGTYTSVVPTFRESGIITSVGKTLGTTTVDGSGITVTLADSLTASNLYLTQGGFDASGFNVTVGLFSSNNTNTRTLNMGSGTWAISGSGSTAWNTSTTTGFTIIPSTSTITMTSASAKIFAGGGLTYHNLNQGGAGALTISGSNTFNNITNSVQPATVTFTAGTTQTVSNFGLSGTAGNLITINSTASGSQFTLSKSSGTVNAQYLSIQDSNATGGATWDASTSNGNVDAGNNTGWNFAPRGNMFLMFM